MTRLSNKRLIPQALWFTGGLGLLFILHQDFWLWENTTLIFGFLPAGLAYHAIYTLIVAIFWAISLYLYWPDTLPVEDNDVPPSAINKRQDDPS